MLLISGFFGLILLVAATSMASVRSRLPPLQLPGPIAPTSQPTPNQLGSPLATMRRTSPYGLRGGGPKTAGFHHGNDFSAAMMTPLHAIENGIISAAIPNNGGGGHTLKLLSLDGHREWTFHHLSAFNVQKGQPVAVGTTIGLTGNTGQSTGPHLHIGLSIDKKEVDPWPYLQRFST